MMNKVVALQPAYVLHTRPFRETSLLVDFLTKDFGRISVVARGAKRSRSAFKGLLQPFSNLLISATGKSSLLNLTHVEAATFPSVLTGNALLSGLYINELLVHLLPFEDPSQEIFTLYQNAIQDLNATLPLTSVLRIFEKRLLELLGLGFSFQTDLDDQPILADIEYCLIPDSGFAKPTRDFDPHNKTTYSGKSILAMQSQEFTDKLIIQECKRLMRHILQHALGEHRLKVLDLAT